MELLVKVLPAVFSYEDMKRRFAQDNPDDPYTRRADLESGIYELDSWLIRVDDNDKAISTVGFKEHPSHTVVGGMYATAEGRKIGGNSKALQDAREPQLNQSKPLVAAFGHRDGDNARWIANAKKNGWSFPDSDNWEQMSKLIPNDVLSAWLAKYPERMAIRSIRDEGQMAKCVYLDDPTPQWFSLMKSNYKRQLGNSGFNVIRTSDGKRMNSKGLSRSQAKSMIDDLESGKDVSRYQKKRKSITGGWKGQLRKWQPSKADGYMEFTQYKTQDSGDEESYIHEDLMSMKGTNNRIMATGHYMNRGRKRVGTNDEKLHLWAKKIINSGKPTKRMSNWFYMTPDGTARDFKVMFDVVPPNAILPQQFGQNRGFIKNPDKEELIVFTTILDRKHKVNFKDWYDMWDEGVMR